MRTPLIAAAVVWSAPALAPVWPPVALALGVPLRRPASDRVLWTFDDGPHPSGTPAVLDRLDAANTKGLFFLVGEQVDRDPGLACEIIRRGHDVGVHGYRHRNLLRIPPPALNADLDRAHDTIAAATGVEPTLYRPPYGIFSLGALAEIRRREWSPLLWSHWGRDWTRRATPEGIAGLVGGDLGPGDVVLLHDSDAYSARGSWRNTVGALERLLPAIR